MSQLTQAYQDAEKNQAVNKQDCDGNTILHKECRYDILSIIQACQKEPYQKWPVKWGIHLNFGRLIVDALLEFYKETAGNIDKLEKMPLHNSFFPFLTAEKVGEAVSEARSRKERTQQYLDDPDDEGDVEVDAAVLDWPLNLEEEIADFLAIQCRHWGFCGRIAQTVNIEVVRKLIENGALLSIENDNGERPIDLLLGL